MAKLSDITRKIRSKNAGPFWLTIDIFCADGPAYDRVCEGLANSRVAHMFGMAEEQIKRFEIVSLKVVKFSLPRPAIQGAPQDRDMHGASWAALLAEVDIT